MLYCIQRLLKLSSKSSQVLCPCPCNMQWKRLLSMRICYALQGTVWRPLTYSMLFRSTIYLWSIKEIYCSMLVLAHPWSKLKLSSQAANRWACPFLPALFPLLLPLEKGKKEGCREEEEMCGGRRILNRTLESGRSRVWCLIEKGEAAFDRPPSSVRSILAIYWLFMIYSITIFNINNEKRCKCVCVCAHML